MALGKGDRVRVVGGRKSKGATGTIFWVGENKYGEGQRFGLHGDDGETHWIPEEHCEPWSEAPPEPTGPEVQRGDRVRWTEGEQPLEGEVFWLGPNKFGPGTRCGVKDDDGETHWVDSRKLIPGDHERRPGAAEPDGGFVPTDLSEPPLDADVWDGSPLSTSPDVPPDWDEPPPPDDAYADAVAVPADEEIYDDEVPY